MKSLASFLNGLLRSRYGAVLIGMVLFCAVALVTRFALLLGNAEQVSWDISLLGSLALGFVFDIGAACFAFLPLVFLLAILPTGFFRKRWVGMLGCVFAYIVCFAMLFGGVAEWFFWEEFGARFNFIAVDYLVYTHEVIGNIRESYPLPWIFGGLGLVSLFSLWLLLRSGKSRVWIESAAQPWRQRIKGAFVWSAVMLALGLAINEEYLPNFANNFNRELAKNGLWSLFAAFRANQLDYDQFYPTMPHEAAFRRMKQTLVQRDSSALLSDDPTDLLRLVARPNPDAPEQHLNVIQITVESLSAEFLARYGNQQGITPFLDGLMPQSLIFDQFYATGNRTDRGMEALTLSVPPTPGRSLVKRPNNDHLFTLGSVFRSRGYDTAFIYGGYGYFDNMNAFFGGNGYRVIDRSSVKKDDISFANAWGACDEDVFKWTIREADKIAGSGRPFHFFVMTTSNHRPYTFPEGRIDLPSKSSGRAGAVKYTDFAIRSLIEQASSHPWFNNTVFVIVADHCASSAGKAELPVARYHIPLIIYAPGGQLPKGAVTTLSSQVDYAPTLLALLNWSYPSRFYGWSVLPNPQAGAGRAFIANYQKLGFLVEEELDILKPVKVSTVLHLDDARKAKSTASHASVGLNEAIASYQTASWLFKHRKQSEFKPENTTARRFAADRPSQAGVALRDGMPASTLSR